jgi:hypothetical protein
MRAAASLPPCSPILKVAYQVNKSALSLYRMGFNRFNTLCGGWCGCHNVTWSYRAALRDDGKYGKDVYVCKVGFGFM